MSVIPAGYKQTEVGVIPLDWEVGQLGGVAQLKNGYAFQSSTYSDLGGYKVVTIANVQDGYMTVDECNKVASLPQDIQSHQRLCRNDILISMTGNVGRVCRVSEDDCLLNQRVGKLMPAGVDDSFLFALLTQRKFLVSMGTKAKGGAQGNLAKSDITEFWVAAPSDTGEQRSIAAALSDVDALLAKLDQFIAKKRDLKQAAMQQLLTGQTRLPGFSGEWEVKAIGDFTDCTAGGTPSTAVSAYWGGNIRWMSSGELSLKKVDEVEGRITELGLKNSSTKMVPSNCVLVGLAGQGKTRGTVAMNYVQLCTNQSIAAIFPNQAFVPEFLYYNLDARYEELRMLSTGDGGRGGLNLKIIRSVVVPFPKLEEQTAIATVLSDMDAELAALEARRDKTRALKQGMMQELLTGRIRLV